MHRQEYLKSNEFAARSGKKTPSRMILEPAICIVEQEERGIKRVAPEEGHSSYLQVQSMKLIFLGQ